MSLDDRRILLIGNTGQLGWELQRCLLPLGPVTPVDFPEIDLQDPDSLRDWVRKLRPALVVNAAAFTDVDQAEVETGICQAVNASAPGVLAEESASLGALMIHFSTDYVFGGDQTEPYTEADRPAPVNFYGRSKLAGESAVQAAGGSYFIFRTSWLYSTRRACFLTRVLNWARSSSELRIAADQTGSPTWARTLAEASAHAIQTAWAAGQDWIDEYRGIYHLAGAGSVNRFEWAQTILDFDPGQDEHRYTGLVKARSEEFGSPARRPVNSALECALFQGRFNLLLPDWDLSLRLALST